MTPNVVLKIETQQLPAPVELFWIDQAGSKHRRKLINTHTQKRSRRLKRLNHASSHSAERDSDMMADLRCCTKYDTLDDRAPAASGDSQYIAVTKEARSLENALKIEENSTLCTSLSPAPLSSILLLDFDPFDSLSRTLNNHAGNLLKFAQTLALNTDTISSHWGKSCVVALGLSWSFSYPVKLLNLLERVSAYIDTVQGITTSQRTIFWRQASIQRLATLISDPHTRHGEEVLSGIIALLHGYLHQYRGDDKGSVMTIGPHSAGLRDFVSHAGGWDKLALTTHVEQYVRMALIMTSLRLASYLDDHRESSHGSESLLGWHAEIDRVVSLFTQMEAWALQHDPGSSQKDPEPLLDELARLIAGTTGICNHCHKLFVLVWLSLTRWHSRIIPGQYQDTLQTLECQFHSLPHRALPDFSWAIVSSRVGNAKSNWQTIEILKVLHRARSSTQDQLCRWLFNFAHGTVEDGFMGMRSCLSELLMRDALVGQPKGRGAHSSPSLIS
ncbi:hypothetical protein AYO21_04288 [Fonsecaea monophora]|uniref:Uncharacterized protein n=1 Tax=Fonsecaea monophora TaxID=254056 RepID=A0A177FCT3_9EURO|nr:hypothetical protein AYO21_04288 [Fonsecaea monophora]OAG41586.1 hypothetical protein AYO21_04288 [Fonsecaea monophora]